MHSLLAPRVQPAPGADIARWLDDAFQHFGAPLFLRMDNAANENCPEVMAVLAKYWVIPFSTRCPPSIWTPTRHWRSTN